MVLLLLLLMLVVVVVVVVVLVVLVVTLPVLVVDDNNSSQFSIASNKSEDDVKVSRYSCNLGIVYIHCRLVCKQYSHVGLDSSH